MCLDEHLLCSLGWTDLLTPYDQGNFDGGCLVEVLQSIGEPRSVERSLLIVKLGFRQLLKLPKSLSSLTLGSFEILGIWKVAKVEANLAWRGEI